MRQPIVVLVLLALALAGCGSDEKDKESAGTAATQDRPAAEREPAEVAERYIRALAAKDWKTACSTRTTKDKEGLAQVGGSCERAFEVIAANQKGAVEIFRDARAGDVRIQGDKASVDILQPGQTKPATTVLAVREGDRWLLESDPSEKNE
jgi:hypothetical protein